jgi:CubicO group peptidase (beta-lactamase class C family)
VPSYRLSLRGFVCDPVAILARAGITPSGCLEGYNSAVLAMPSARPRYGVEVNVFRRILSVIAVLGIGASGCAVAPATPAPNAVTQSIAPSADAASVSVIARYQQTIPELMREQDIPGLSVAVVDEDHILWAQGFGYGDKASRTPIDIDTIFSVQSMSKLFTATAVMIAVQEGRVGLDTPIIAYLPTFTVHSAFEDHPERKITLRMLLSHTAGFTHEAPVGNNYELDSGTWDQHIASISETWLRYPVGKGYAYSNLGIDLAGYILERVCGKPLAAIMQEKVLDPIGMTDSTFETQRIDAAENRAIGYTGLGIPSPTVIVPMTGAGGLYASANDLGRFLSFQISGGSIDGRNVLSPTLMDEMRTVPAPNAGVGMGYALGVMRTRWRAERYQDLFYHGGGGYGFLSDLWWAPSLKLGVAILTNSSEHKLQNDLAISIMRDLVDASGSVFAQRLAGLPAQSDVVDIDTGYQAPADMSELLAATAMPATTDQDARWATYAGAYKIASMGVVSPTAYADRFFVEGGVPWFDVSENEGPPVRHRLIEHQPGLFIADNGEMLDFRSLTPTWRNLDLVRANESPALWQWVLVGLAVLASAAWFFGSAALFLRRRLRRSGRMPASTVHPRLRLAMSVLASLAALVALATSLLLIALPGLVDSGFLGGLQVPIALRLVLHLPLVLAMLAATMVVLEVVALARRWYGVQFEVRFGVLAVALGVLAIQLMAWHLVGWALS